MKKLILITLFAFFHNAVYCQLEQNQTIEKCMQLLTRDQPSLNKYLEGNGYVFRARSGNFYQYEKNTQVSSYTFTASFRNGKMSGLSWDEFVGQFDKIQNELSFLKYHMTSSGLFGEREIRAYENVPHNLLVTITIKGNYFTVVLGAKNPDKPIIAYKPSYIGNSGKTTKEKISTSIQNVNFSCAPRIYNAKVLSKPNLQSIHTDWIGSELGMSWGFEVKKIVKNANGTFYTGNLISPRGGKQIHGPYYIVATEWEK